MNHFNTFKFKSEEADIKEVKIVKLEADKGPVIADYKARAIKNQLGQDYKAVKEKYGALAVTDTDRKVRGQKERGFSLHQMVRQPLSVDDEERRVVDERVNAKLAEMSDEVKKLAYEEGFKEGFEKSKEESDLKFREEALIQIQRIDDLVRDFEGAKKLIFKANERFLIEMIYRIARRISLKEVKQDPDYILKLSAELIERLGVRDNIKIRVSQKNIDSLGSLKSDLELKLGQLKNLDIEVSNELTDEGCLVETEWSAIDARLETQLEEVHLALLQAADLSTGEEKVDV